MQTVDLYLVKFRVKKASHDTQEVSNLGLRILNIKLTYYKSGHLV